MGVNPLDHHLLQVSSPSSSSSSCRFLLCSRVAKRFGGRLLAAGLEGCWAALRRFSLEPQYCSRMSWSDTRLSTGHTGGGVRGRGGGAQLHTQGRVSAPGTRRAAPPLLVLSLSPALGLFVCSSLQGDLTPPMPLGSDEAAADGGESPDGALLKALLQMLGPAGPADSFQLWPLGA